LKKTTHIFLLAILLIQSGGLYLVYRFQQFQAREEMRESLLNGQASLQTIHLSLDEYQNSKTDEKEIILSGKLYDIKSIRFQGNTAELVVTHDKKEEGVLGKIKRYMENKHLPDDMGYQLMQLLSLNYVVPVKEKLTPVSFTLSNYFPEYSCSILCNTAGTFTPPPEA
jgi:hypothetical protein